MCAPLYWRSNISNAKENVTVTGACRPRIICCGNCSEKVLGLKRTGCEKILSWLISVEERYNPLLKKDKVFRPSLVLRVQDEKIVETGTHQEFPLNLSGVCHTMSF